MFVHVEKSSVVSGGSSCPLLPPNKRQRLCHDRQEKEEEEEEEVKNVVSETNGSGAVAKKLYVMRIKKPTAAKNPALPPSAEIPPPVKVLPNNVAVAVTGSAPSHGRSMLDTLFPGPKRTSTPPKEPEGAESAVAVIAGPIIQEPAMAASPSKRNRQSQNSKSKSRKKDGKSKSKNDVVPLDGPLCRDGVCYALVKLKAFRLEFVLRKALTVSDLKRDQNRLLITKNEYNDHFLLTDDEHQQVLNAGLPVEALDRHGLRYNLLLRYLDTIDGYRLRAEWGRFLRQHGLDEKKNVGDIVELQAFRSPVRDGRLGFVLLHYDKGSDVEEAELAGAAEEEEEEEKPAAVAAAADAMTDREVCAAMIMLCLRYAA